MRAIRLVEPERLSVTDVPPPTGEVTIRVEAVGVCGSDVGAYLGKPAYEFVSLPRTLGHEYVGTVEEVSTEGSDLRPGDRVVERPTRSCGTCLPCRRGDDHVCENLRLTGFHHDGAFATHTAAPETALHRVPSDVPVTRAAMTEPLAVAYRGVVRIGGVEPGERVLVLGPGPIGALSALLADRAGGEVRVVGLPRDERRLELLAGMGIETEVLSSDGSPTAEAVDVAIDATGSTSGIETAVAAVRAGGRVVVLGIPSGELGLDVASLVRSETHVLTSYSCRSDDFNQVISLQTGSRAIPVERLTTTYPAMDPTAAFEAFVAGDPIKPIFEPTELRADQRSGD